jgi:hypothetical protein
LSSSAKTRIDAARAARRGRSCPPGRDLVAAFADGAGLEAKSRVLDHVAVCPDCAHKFRALLELWRHRGGIPADVGSVPDLKALARRQVAEMRARRRARVLLGCLPGRRVLSLAAGVAAIFLCVVTYTLWKDGKAVDVDRVMAPGGIALLSPRSGEAVRPSFLFRWSAVEDATGYALEILNTALLPILTFPHLSETAYEPSSDDLGKLERGKVYFWKVIADLGDLRRIESRIERFTVPD